MRSIKLIAVFVVLISFFASSCKSEPEIVSDPGFNYYPISQGRYIVYQVDSIVYDVPVQIQDTFNYFIREKIDTTFLDAEQRPTVRIERFYTEDLSEPWILKDIWVANRTNMRAEKVEENVRYVKLGYPVTAETSWDGNAFNSLEEWMYLYDNIGIQITVLGNTYDNTVRVIQRDNQNAIEREYYEETYAYDVGMIQKRYEDLELEVVVIEGVVSSEIVRGVKLQMLALEYGVED